MVMKVVDNEQYGKLVEHLFKLITLEYRCYEHSTLPLFQLIFNRLSVDIGGIQADVTHLFDDLRDSFAKKNIVNISRRRICTG